jgi:hypothetical protein
VSGRPRNWTDDDLDRLIALVDDGEGYDAIALELGRSREAVMLKAARIGHRVMTTAATLSARDVARLLGLGCSKTVARWIAEYGLFASDAGSAQKPLWRITWDDLVAWLERPDHWMMYDPARIADSLLRAHLRALRPTEPYWLTSEQVAQQFHVGHRTVAQWIAQGLLPATRYGNWWVCAADLRSFVPPYDRARPTAPPATDAGARASLTKVRSAIRRLEREHSELQGPGRHASARDRRLYQEQIVILLRACPQQAQALLAGLTPAEQQLILLLQRIHALEAKINVSKETPTR